MIFCCIITIEEKGTVMTPPFFDAKKAKRHNRKRRSGYGRRIDWRGGGGILAAVLCAVFYRRGVRDGLGIQKRRTVDAAAGDEQSELMKKYEMIMNYDPYGERV